MPTIVVFLTWTCNEFWFGLMGRPQVALVLGPIYVVAVGFVVVGASDDELMIA